MNGELIFKLVKSAVYFTAALYTAVELHLAYEKDDICGVVYYSVLLLTATVLFVAGIR